jgi:hypothetical protein
MQSTWMAVEGCKFQMEKFASCSVLKLSKFGAKYFFKLTLIENNEK